MRRHLHDDFWTTRLWSSCVLLLVLQSAAGQHNRISSNGVRQQININREWKFILGDIAGAQEEVFNDRDWKLVHLPHNFSIPYFQSAHWYSGYGWYRKIINVPVGWLQKKVFIEFEAAFRVAEIFVNGQRVGQHAGGYTGFSIDISSALKAGRNVLSVRLNNEWNPRLAPRNGDHNFTGGIYRDVYLVVTDPVHVNWYGTYVTTPDIAKGSGVVNIQTEITNAGNAGGKYELQTSIINPAGRMVSTVTSAIALSSGQSVMVNQLTPAVPKPLLWHPDHPYLYKAITTIYAGQKILDQYETSFGFRWTKWAADSGFYLNGAHYYFKGANAHQDQAGWASAVTNSAMLRDVKMIKDIGMDFIRGSHYPHDPYYSSVCDSLGVLLWQENDFWGSGGDQRETDNWYTGAGAYPMNEADQRPFEESVKNDLREMIRIHRNHPSIIVWSMCNEPFFTNGKTIGKVRTFLKELTALTHELDPSRPVGIGGCQRGDIDKLGDVAGYNGDGARLFINPGIPNVVTEYGSTIAKRPGRYIPGWGDMAKQIDSNYRWRSGQAIWCAFDYGTRAGDFGLMGMVDYFRLPKNQWYWYRNEYMKIPPPPPAKEGVAAKLKLEADKKVIAATDGTDDVQLIVSVLDKEGNQLSNSPDVMLKIVSGPGQFPTGSSITFSNNSDIYIRDGKAAISFRSYYAGKTMIKALAEGLESATIEIQTKGSPSYVEGITPEVEDIPYVRYVWTRPVTQEQARNDIAYQKPTRAGSEVKSKTANLANDNDTTTFWQAELDDQDKWWQVDLENLYKVSAVQVFFGSAVVSNGVVELSMDGQKWEKVNTPPDILKKNTLQTIPVNSKVANRFLRIYFPDSKGKNISIREVKVFGTAK